VSTSTLGGHVNTINGEVAGGRSRRRRHSEDFKAEAVAACAPEGMSIAAVALSRGINANLLRRWVKEAELEAGERTKAAPASRSMAGTPSFMPVQLPAPARSSEGIRVELRRGAATVVVSWPVEAASECAAWMRELLR
jgi:transposase